MKRTKLLLALVAVVVLCLSLAACDNHTHTYGEWTLTTQPTETATGEATRTCTECGEAETVTVAALSDTTVWTASTTAATHTEDGKTVYTSTYGTVEIKLPKLADNHVFDKQVVDAKYLKSEATCTEAAVYYKSCACGESSKEHGGETFTTGEALGHDFEHGTEVAGSRKAATCIAAGEYKVKCSRCDEVTTIALDIDPNAHDWNEGTITKPATCSAEGVKTFTCKHDSTHTKTESVAIDPDAHDWNEGVITMPATCSATGVKTYTCAHNSNHTRTETVPVDPNAHKAETDWTIDTPATCTQNGSKSHHCEYCDAKLDNEVIPATGHDEYQFVSWETEPTETAAGVANVKCGKCNAELTQEVAALTDSMWTKTETPATYDAAGNKAYTATVFGSEQTINVAIARHIAPYEGKTYQLVSFGNSNGYINGKYFKDPDNDSVSYYITYSFVVGEAGLSTDTFNKINATYYTDGKVQFSGYDASTGKFTVTFTYKEKTFSGYDDYGWDPEETVDKEETTWGCVSADGSALYIYKDGSGRTASHYFAVAGTEQIAVSGTQAQAASLLLDGNKAVCLQLGSTMFFVDENNVVFGATLADLEGNALTIANYTDSTVVIVNDASGTKVGAFARVVSADGKADYIACDGYEGIYTGGLGEQAYINGVGGITVKGLGYELVGTYAKVEGSDNEFDVLLDNGGMEYYLVTVTGNTYTKTKVMTTINYDLDGGTLPDGKTSDSVNIKVEFTLPTPAKDGYKFMGWYKVKLDGEFDEESFVEDGKTTIEQAEGMEHVFYARFVENANITFTNLDGQEDKHVSACVNDKLLANAPEYVENVTKHSSGTQIFAGWYLDKNFTRKIDAYYEVTEADAGQSITVYAKWADLNTLKLVYGHGIEDKELYMALNDNISELIAAANANIKYNGGRPFVGWYIDTNGNGIVDAEEALLTESDVCSGNMTLVAKWNEEVSWTFKPQTYTFVYDPSDSQWKSNNQGKGNTSAVLEFYAVGGSLEYSFDVWASGEKSFDYVTVNYYDANGTEKSVDKIGTASTSPTADDIKHFSGVLPYDPADKTHNIAVRISFKKDGSGDKGNDTAYVTNLVINGVTITTTNSPDFKDGTYTNETLGNLVLNGVGAGTIGGESLTYTIAAKDAGYTLLAKTATKTYKVTLNGSTYTAVEWNVMVSFDLGIEGQTLEDITLAYGTNYTLPDGKEIEGYIFRGWYKEAGFTNKITSVELTENVTVYAKYDPAVTLTFDYNGQGTENVVINGKFKGDTIGNVIPDASELTKDGQSFVGWFLKDGENWGEKATADTILQNSVTYYAKWAEAHPMAGSYAGANLDPAENGIVKETDTLSASSYNFEVDVEGNVTGWKTGEIVDFDATSGVFYLDVSGSKYYGGFNAEAKVMYVEYSPKSSAYHDIAFAAGSFGEVTPTATYNNAWDKGITKLVRITYSDSSVRYVFIRDRVVYTVSETSIVAKDNSGAAVTFEKIYSDAATLSFVAKNNGQVETTFNFARSGNNFILMDGFQGEYSGVETLTIDGHGGFTMGEQTGTYTIADEGSGYTLLAKTTSAAYKITLNDATYTAEAYTVTVSFNFGDFAEEAGTFADQVVPYGVKTTLNVAPNIAGYKFKGWYDNADFGGNVYEEVTITENKTFYAKYEILVEVKFDFSGYEYEEGQTVKVIDTLAVNDTLGDTIPTVPADATLDGKVFDGWFVKNGEEWGDKISATTKITEAVTFYAKWIEPHELYGSYVGFETWSTGKGNLTSSKTATIDTKGNVSKAERISGSINYNAETGAVSAGSYTGYYSAKYGILIYNYNIGSTATADIYVLFKNVKSVTASTTNQYSWNTGLNKLIDVTVENLDGTKESFTVYYADGKIQKCTWTADEGITTVAGLYNSGLKTNTLNIFDLDGNAIASFGKVGSDLQPLDGNQGTYTLTDSFNIVVDGHGGVVCDTEASVSYTVLENGNLTFAKAGIRMVVVSLDKANGTYAFVADGYAGTYTLPDNTTIEFYGDGTAENGKTYVVDGTNVTIFENGVGTKYKADFEAKTLEEPGFSFAGKRFQKDTYSYIVFDNTESISGKFYFETEDGSADIIFKDATFDGSVLTIVVAGGSKPYYINKGKTVEFEYADGKLTLKSKAGLNESWLNVGAVLELK